MVSVDNFYWILQHNLLKPTGLDCWYYFPWGTKENLSKTEEFKIWHPKNEHHVLFHFDQEAIFEYNLGNQYDSLGPAWSTKLVRILANSEQSEMKKKICQQRGMLDWYFFYHGFAALDWFRDAQYINQTQTISQVYNSFNHLVTGNKSYRMALTARLIDLNTHGHGDISFHGSIDDCIAEVKDPESFLSDKSKIMIERILCKVQKLPMILDRHEVNGNFSAHFGHGEYSLWQKSFLHIVNETVFYHQKLHLTEKIFKPIIAERPFILVAAPGNLAYLRKYGFETFSPWIDESYDMIDDTDLRLDMIAAEVSKFCQKNPSDLRRIHKEMLPVLEHNKKHFFGSFRNIIVDELIENFDACLRVWNNGRVDGRERPRHSDLASVKRLLLG